jgi:hypothetical protein
VYKFQVLNPLGIKTKIYRSPSSVFIEETRALESLKKVIAEIKDQDHAYDDPASLSSLLDEHDRLADDGRSNDSCYMEIQIQNQSSKPLLNLALTLSPPQAQNQDNQEEESVTRRIEQVHLKKERVARTPTGAESYEQIMPGDIHQYAFQVSENRRTRNPEHVRQYELEISWTSLMGERGRVRRRIEADETAMPTRQPSESLITMMGGPETPGSSTVVAQSRFFKAELLRDPRPIVGGVPFQVELRISSLANDDPQIEPGSDAHSLGQSILTSPLLMRSFRIHDIHPLLLLLSPQPLLPLSSPAGSNTPRSFLLTYLPLDLPLLPSLLPLGRLASSIPHLDSLLFGFDASSSSSSSQNSASLGSVFLQHA